MELVKLADLHMTYRTLEMLDYGVGGQIYGTLDGTLTGERLSGSIALTNLAGRRPDGVNLPTLRGLLTTPEGATVWLEADGIAVLREADGARVYVTSVRFRTGDERLGWLNTVLGVIEGVLDTVGVGGVSHGTVWECRPTLT
jgi:hypothetical protein